MRRQKTEDRGQRTEDRGQKILICVLLFCCSAALFLGCKKKEEVKPVEAPAKPPVPIEVPPPQYETYQYLDMGRRDPFVSLREPGIGGGPRKGEVEVVLEEGTKTEETGLEGFAISGFIWDKKEKIAVIKGQEESYLLLTQGMLFDRNGEPVPDIKAKLKDDGILLTKNKKDIFLKMEGKNIKEEDVIQ